MKPEASSPQPGNAPTTATKAVTICQPYAELIARGEKPIENRTWPTQYRGRIAIHAGKSRAWMDDDDTAQYPGMAFGAVVAIADLVACFHIDRPWPPRWAHLRDHPHANGPYCWVLENIRRIDPIPCRGAQGLWDWAQTPAEAQSAANMVANELPGESK